MFMCEQEHLWTEVILFGTFFFSEGAWGEGLSGRGVYLRTQQSVHTLSTSEWRPLIEDTQYLSFLWWNETDCQCDVGKKTLWNIAFVVVVGWGFSRTAESSFRNVCVCLRSWRWELSQAVKDANLEEKKWAPWKLLLPHKMEFVSSINHHGSNVRQSFFFFFYTPDT